MTDWYALVMRIRHEAMRRSFNREVLEVIRSLRIGPEQEMDLKINASTTGVGVTIGDVMDSRICGLAFSVDYSFDGIEVEYIDDGWVGEKVRAVCAKLDLPCRAI